MRKTQKSQNSVEDSVIRTVLLQESYDKQKANLESGASLDPTIDLEFPVALLSGIRMSLAEHFFGVKTLPDIDQLGDDFRISIVPYSWR